MKLFLLLLLTYPVFVFSQSDNESITSLQRYRKKVKFFKSKSNCDSILFYQQRIVDLSDDVETKIRRISYVMNTYEQFNRAGDAYKLGILSLEKYCNDSPNNYDSYPIVTKIVSALERIEAYQEAIDLLKKYPHKGYRRSLWNYRLAKQYTLIGAHEKALDLIRTFIKQEVEKNTINYHILIDAYNNYGLIAAEVGEYKVAKKSYLRAIHLIDSNQIRSKLKPTIIGNIGAVYFKEGRIDSAYNCILKDAKESLKFGVVSSYLNAEIHLMDIEFRKREFKKTILRAKKIYVNYERELPIDQQLFIYELLIKSYTVLQEYKQQKVYLEKWISLMKKRREEDKKLFLIASKMAIEQARLQLKITKKLNQREIQLAQIDKENLLKETRNTQLIFGLLVLVLVMLVATISSFFWRYKIIQTKNKLLKEAELETSRKEQQILELKVNEEVRNVQELSLELITKQSFSSVILERLRKLGTISKSDLVNIETFIENELRLKSTLAETQDKMGNLSTKFHSELKIKHPKLTPNELKLAVMVVMKMTNKEISISKNVTPAYVRLAKVRLKKKMNLPPNQDLYTYLNNFLM